MTTTTKSQPTPDERHALDHALTHAFGPLDALEREGVLADLRAIACEMFADAHHNERWCSFAQARPYSRALALADALARVERS